MNSVLFMVLPSVHLVVTHFKLSEAFAHDAHHSSNPWSPQTGTVRTMEKNTGILDGKVAMVAGGTKGLGRGIADVLAHNGAAVVVTGRSASGDDARHPSITLIRCDHRDDEDVDAAFTAIASQHAAIDILVNAVWGGYENMVEGGQFTGRSHFGTAAFGAGTRCSPPVCAPIIAPANWRRGGWWRGNAA